MGTMTWRSALLIGLASLGVSSATLAQPTVPPPAAQAQPNGREVATAVRQLLNANYVLPELRSRFDAVLAKGLAEGRYDVADRDRLVGLINADLRQVTPDKHLGVMVDPERSRRLALAPPGGGADDAQPTPEDIRQAIRINHGIAELKVLPGNLRYLRYDAFVWAGPKTAEALDTAMRFLRDGQAVVIDLRGNGGGSPEAVQYLVSHFLEPGRPIVTFYMRGEPAERFSTLASVPAGRMVGKPLYVLVGGMTASAAEEFSGHVAGFGIGELVGETTAGAAFRNELYALPQGLVISISVGRAVLASTGKDWEAVGIAPTLRIAPETGARRGEGQRVAKACRLGHRRREAQVRGERHRSRRPTESGQDRAASRGLCRHLRRAFAVGRRCGSGVAARRPAEAEPGRDRSERVRLRRRPDDPRDLRCHGQRGRGPPHAPW